MHLSDNWGLDIYVYGRGHTDERGSPGELFVVAEALAPSRELASSIASKARVGLIVSVAGGRSVGNTDARKLMGTTACTIPWTESNFRQCRLRDWRFNGD